MSASASALVAIGLFSACSKSTADGSGGKQPTGGVGSTNPGTCQPPCSGYAPVCESSTHKCQPCVVDSDCGQGFCLVHVAGMDANYCTQCRTAADCTAGQFCVIVPHTPTNECVACGDPRAPCSTSSASSSSTGGLSCSGATPVLLTIKNYMSGCMVAVGANSTSTLPAQQVCVADGKLTVAATPAGSGLQLGAPLWHDTDGDTGNGDPGTITGAPPMETSSTTVTASGSTKCAWVCCQSALNGTCPAIDQCP